MPANDLIEEALRAQLTAVVADVTPTTDLASIIHRRYLKRKLRSAGIFAVAAIGLSAAAVVVHDQTDDSPSHAQATIDLVGYSVSLPPGVHASALKFTPASTFPASPPSPSILVRCQSTGVGFLMNSPTAWGAPPYQQPALTNFAITSPSGDGCVSGLMTLPYDSGTAPSRDLVAPSSATSVSIDRFPTKELDSSTPSVSGYVYYVQLPATGGGYQDLIVGTLGISQRQTVSLVKQVITEYEAKPSPATASKGSAVSSR